MDPHVHSTRRARIFVTSDIHAHLADTRLDSVEEFRFEDISRMKSGLFAIQKLFAERNPNTTLVIDNGDTMLGSQMQEFFRQQNEDLPVSKILAEIGYDNYTPGNHDFDEGLPKLLEFASQWGVDKKITLANISYRDDNPHHETISLHFTPYRIHQRNGIKIAVIGIMTQAIHEMNNAEQLGHMNFLDPVTTLNQLIPTVKLEADVIAVSYHGGIDWDLATEERLEPAEGKLENENEAYRILTEVSDIDVLITGHQHRVIEHTFRHKTPVIQVGYGGTHYGEIGIEIDAKNGKTVTANVRSVSEQMSAKGYTLSDDAIVELLTLHEEYRAWKKEQS